MDTRQIKDDYYRMFFNRRGKLIVIPIKKEESKIKPKKVINKISI